MEPIVLKWNNAMIREVCPECKTAFKPSWGPWPFLEGTYTPVCLECMATHDHVTSLFYTNLAPKTRSIMDVLDALEPGCIHDWQVTDTQGHSMECSFCGKSWSYYNDNDEIEELELNEQKRVQGFLDKF